MLPFAFAGRLLVQRNHQTTLQVGRNMHYTIVHDTIRFLSFFGTYCPSLCEHFLPLLQSVIRTVSLTVIRLKWLLEAALRKLRAIVLYFDPWLILLLMKLLLLLSMHSLLLLSHILMLALRWTLRCVLQSLCLALLLLLTWKSKASSALHCTQRRVCIWSILLLYKLCCASKSALRRPSF